MMFCANYIKTELKLSRMHAQPNKLDNFLLPRGAVHVLSRLVITTRAHFNNDRKSRVVSRTILCTNGILFSLVEFGLEIDLNKD